MQGRVELLDDYSSGEGKPSVFTPTRRSVQIERSPGVGIRKLGAEWAWIWKDLRRAKSEEYSWLVIAEAFYWHSTFLFSMDQICNWSTIDLPQLELVDNVFTLLRTNFSS